MDRGVPTEEVLAEMRAADPPVHYLVGTPKGRLTRLEKHLVARPWQEARPGVQVKLLAQEGELYVLAQSRDRVAKERAMRRRQLKRLWARLKQLSTMQLTREELLMKLGAARDQSRIAWRLVVIEVADDSATFSYRLDRNKLRQARSRRPLSLAHQPRRGRPGQAVEPLPAPGRGRGGVQEPQRRSCDPAGLSPARGPHRGACLHRLPGLLVARHPGAAPACVGVGADAAQRVGKVRRRADDRRAPADHRRSRADAHPLYRARSRAQPLAKEAETGAARPTTTQNHGRRTSATHPAVVPTFGGPPQQCQTLRYSKMLQSAKLG